MARRTQDEINDEMDFRSAELDRVKGDRIRLKIESSDGDTRWLSITPSELNRVALALLHFDLEEEL